jgi:MraZ protein
MPEPPGLYLGEWARSLDERYRLSLPAEVAELLATDAAQCTLAKERPGCLSLWHSREWQRWLDEGIELVRNKIRGGRLQRRIESVQMFGRLLSTRHKQVPIAGRGRLAIPDAFRHFLGVEPGGDVQVVGAAVCVEIWHPQKWSEHIGEHMPEFRSLFDQLTE